MGRAVPSHVPERPVRGAAGSAPRLRHRQPLELGGNPEILPYLPPGFRLAEPNERGWKDTLVIYPGEVTSILVRFAPQDERAGRTRAGRNYYSFDPAPGPGYVWHCHILDHEDNETMRPMLIR